MTSFFNALMMVMNYASGQQVNGTTYFTPTEQVSARIEVIFPDQNLVEEFHVIHDRALKLTKFEYGLDLNVPPFRTSNVFKSVWDDNTGLVYHMDQNTGSCSVGSMETNADDAFTSTYSLLKMLSPEQIFSVTNMMKFVKKDFVRGIATDQWTMDVDNFYVTGYGRVKTRHTLQTLSGNVTKYYRGIAKPAVILQRSIEIVRNGRSSSNVNKPVVILNFFDFFSPATPQIYDFNVMTCPGGGVIRGSGMIKDNKEEIQLKFSGKIKMAGFGENAAESEDVTEFRRSVWMGVAKAIGLSPIRMVGNFWSHDDWNTFFTTVLLPQPKMDSLQFSGEKNATGKRNFEILEDLGKILLQQGLQVTVGNNTLTAIDMRKNVSLLSSTKGEKTADVFVLYKAFTTIAGKGVKTMVQKLTNKQCTERCERENRFVCQSVATCGFGDCILSELHGDELLVPAEDGSQYLANHSHCAIWTRVWTNQYTQILDSAFPEMEPEKTVDFAGREETCAKQCSFPNSDGTDCESFTWCPRSTLVNSFDNLVAKSSCTTYKHHVFDLDAAVSAETEKKNREAPSHRQCRHYTKNYLTDFQAMEASAFAENPDVEVMDIEIGGNSFGEWRCAKACVDKLGDEKCHAIEFCQDEDDSKNLRCRISTAFVSMRPSDSEETNVTIPEINCRIFSRVRYLDGSPVTQRTANDRKISKLGKRSEHFQICEVRGHSGGEMAILALGMLVIGAVLVVILVVVTKRFVPASDVAFVRLVI